MQAVFGSRWDVIKELGEGGQGKTYIVHDLESSKDEKFVLKIIKSPKGIERFKKEVQAIQKLHHNNIVKLIDYHMDEESPFLITEYCEGGSLNDTKPFWKNDPVIAINLFIEICKGVDHAHKNSIIHRDIKPKNIFLRADNTPVVGDFGICFIEDDGSRITLMDEAVGAFKFMAPEMENGRGPVSSKVDVYSLGKLLYWLLSGGKIFNREWHREKEYDLKGKNTDSIFGWNNLYMEHINRILDMMIVLEPERRRDIENIIICLTDAKRLLSNRYNAVDENVPQICYYCGGGTYHKIPDEKVPIKGAEWAFYSCNCCGNIQIFRNSIDKVKKWWKEI